MECPLCSCQFLVGYRHTDLFFILCLECFSIIRQLKLHRNYVRFSSFIDTITTQARLANSKLHSYIRYQVGSLKQLIMSKTIEKYFAKEYCQYSSKLSLSTNCDSEVSKAEWTDSIIKQKQGQVGQKYSQVVNDLINSLQPTKQLFFKKADVLLQSAGTVKQKCMIFRSECRSLVAEIPTLRNFKKDLKGFFKFL